jgi:hypothetical protein
VNAGPGKKLCSALVVGSPERGFTATLHR